MASYVEFTSKRGWIVGGRLARVHVALYRLTGGRIGGTFPGRKNVPIALVGHKGARSGVARTSPLIYVQDGDDIVVVASKGGRPEHPAWFHNLKANPETTIQVGRDVRNVRARVAPDDERDRLWPKCTAMFPEYDVYQRNSKGRKIPLVILEPR